MATPVTILDLPAELLVKIFRCFANPISIENVAFQLRYHQYPRPSPALQSCRLVCHAFNQLASPLLCPAIFVSLSNASLARVHGLLENPLISRGIAIVDLDLRYWCRYVANDWSVYIKHAHNILEEAHRSCLICLDRERRRNIRDDSHLDAREHGSEHAVSSKLRIVKESMGRILEALRKGLDGQDLDEAASFSTTMQNAKQNEEDRVWCNVLEQGFASYAARFQEARHLVRTGDFVRELAAGLAKCGHRLALRFADENDNLWTQTYTRTRVRPIDTQDLLQARLLEPMLWADLESYHSVANVAADNDFLHPARILADLPSACYDAGVSISCIDMSCFPIDYGFTELAGNALGPDGCPHVQAFDKLALACQDMSIFRFKAYQQSDRSPVREPEQEPSIVTSFVSAAISSPKLQTCRLDMTSLELYSGHGDHTDSTPSLLAERGFPIALFSGVISSTLCTVRLVNLVIDAADLTSLVTKLSADHLTHLFLKDIALMSGSYIPMMEMLHGVATARTRQISQAIFDFDCLRGAEFGWPHYPPLEEASQDYEAYYKRLMACTHPPLLVDLVKWLNDGCLGSANPLLEATITRID